MAPDLSGVQSSKPCHVSLSKNPGGIPEEEVFCVNKELVTGGTVVVTMKVKVWHVVITHNTGEYRNFHFPLATSKLVLQYFLSEC